MEFRERTLQGRHLLSIASSASSSSRQRRKSGGGGGVSWGRDEVWAFSTRGANATAAALSEAFAATASGRLLDVGSVAKRSFIYLE
jgi:hypothetical protein